MRAIFTGCDCPTVCNSTYSQIQSGTTRAGGPLLPVAPRPRRTVTVIAGLGLSPIQVAPRFCVFSTRWYSSSAEVFFVFSRKAMDGWSGSRGHSGCRWQVRLSFRPCLPARFKRNSMEVTAFQQENGYKKTSTLANGVPQRGETAFRSAVPCAWSPRVPQALASNCQRFRSCEGSSTVRRPWPEEHKRPSQGDRRYKRVETADTVGALFGAAPHPCATNLQRHDAKQ